MYKVKMNAYEGKDSYIFVSYAHKNADLVLPIIDSLYEAGYRIWFDEGIEADAEWPAYIEDHLSRSSALLAFVTSDFVDSSNCRKEITYALNKDIPLIYVMLEDTPLSNGLDLQLADQQCINTSKMSTERFYEKIAQTSALQECRWKNDDGTEIRPRRIRLRKKKRGKKKEMSLGGRMISTTFKFLLALFLVFVVVIAYEVVRQLNNDDAVSGEMPKEIAHTWEESSNGERYCTTCGVETGEIDEGARQLSGYWASKQINLNGYNSSVFIPNSVVTSCTSMQADLHVRNYSGNPFGTYLLYTRVADGSWQIAGSLEINESAASTTETHTFTFSTPITFTGLSIALKDTGKTYQLDYDLTFKDVRIKY